VNEETARKLRVDSRVRGVVITALITGYGFLFHQRQGSFVEALLVGALLQVAVLLVRRWVPPEGRAVALYTFETIADGITVLLFAMGVLGGIVRMPAEV
jgi:uncharacterized membrane protein (DUF441 family)